MIKAISFVIFTIIGLIMVAYFLSQPAEGHTADREIVFPNIPGYETLVCDFHQHTVFSDGSVCPSIRVEEAQKDGLDAIAVTDHFEWRPELL